MFVTIANAIPLVRFRALLIVGDSDLGLDDFLRRQGCAVARVAAPEATQDAVEAADLVVISASGLADADVEEVARRAASATCTLVATDSVDLAVRVVRAGASCVMACSFELVSAQIAHLLDVIDLKRRVLRPLDPDQGLVQRRSTPVPKEALPHAIEGLVEAAEDLIPMHLFQRVYVDYALRRFGGNKVHTAAALGIDRRTIQRWARATRGGSVPTLSSDLSAAS